jgi:hypothetical protein
MVVPDCDGQFACGARRGLGLGLGVGVDVGVGFGFGDRDGVGLGESDGLGLGLGDDDGDGLVLVLGLGEGEERVGPGDTPSLLDGVGDGLAVTPDGLGSAPAATAPIDARQNVIASANATTRASGLVGRLTVPPRATRWFADRGRTTPRAPFSIIPGPREAKTRAARGGPAQARRSRSPWDTVPVCAAQGAGTPLIALVCEGGQPAIRARPTAFVWLSSNP